ncbi:hypothetical protein MMPV_004501 [Pyropia vietnamensis]
MSDGLSDHMCPGKTSASRLAATDDVTTGEDCPREPECHPCSRPLRPLEVERLTAATYCRTCSVPLSSAPGQAKEEQPVAQRRVTDPLHRPRRSRSLLALLVSEDLAHETDVYEGVPVSCDPGEIRRLSSLSRAASRVLSGSDPEASEDDEVDELDVIRRRSIGVSSLKPGNAAPIVNRFRSRPTGKVSAALQVPLSPRGVVPSLFERQCHPVTKTSPPAVAASASAGTPKGGHALVRMLSSGPANAEALLAACAKGREATVRKLLRAGVSPASADSSGRSALAYAAAGGHMAVVECLVRHAGASAALLRDGEGRSPVDEAVRAGHVEVARFLEAEVRTAAH